MGKELKVISYNIHTGIGTDGVLDLDRIASIIAREDGDIVGLNEVDCCTSRSQGVDQVKYIGEKLGYPYIFGKTIDYSGGEYGNAFLSKYPIVSYKNHRLPILSSKTREPRAMLECHVDIDGHEIQVFTTHLGLDRDERKLSIDYIAHVLEGVGDKTILLGDFNITYDGEFDDIAPLTAVLKDTARELGKADEIMTFSSDNPNIKIDYILVSKDIRPVSTYVLQSTASDHLPLICHVDIS